jgi:formate hydrogenlyase subunit 6/NADH:ubiquinone oxidoreductase subunit I
MKSAALKLAFNTKPQVKKSECIGCKKCYETCPAKAITMVRSSLNQGATRNISIPSIDRSKCIKCFCCQEFCPVGAMKVHRTPLAKLLSKNK